jgi:hypothetical protein
MNATRLLLTLVALGSACRTRPEGEQPATQDGGPSADLRSFSDAAVAGFVNCGPMTPCSIAAGSHCCDQTPLVCQTAPCKNSNQFDCDGPEDCNGTPCCFPIRNALSRAACARTCDTDTTLCHSKQDCPANTVCCLNFVLGPMNGLCLGACD